MDEGLQVMADAQGEATQQVPIPEGNGLSLENTTETAGQAVVEPLSDTERVVLETCERTIENGLQTYVGVGLALIRVRDGKLYREKHSSFDGYLGERWSMDRKRASELILAAKIAEGLPEDVKPPTREAHATALGKVPEVFRERVWRAVVEQSKGGRITSADIDEMYAVLMKAGLLTEEKPERPLSETHPRFSHPEAFAATCPKCGHLHNKWQPLDDGVWRCNHCGHVVPDAQMNLVSESEYRYLKEAAARERQRQRREEREGKEQYQREEAPHEEENPYANAKVLHCIIPRAPVVDEPNDNESALYIGLIAGVDPDHEEEAREVVQILKSVYRNRSRMILLVLPED